MFTCIQNVCFCLKIPEDGTCRTDECVGVETCNMSITPPAGIHLILVARGKYKYDCSIMHHLHTTSLPEHPSPRNIIYKSLKG